MPSSNWKCNKTNFYNKGDGSGMNPNASGIGTITRPSERAGCVQVTWDSGYVHECPINQLAYVDDLLMNVLKL